MQLVFGGGEYVLLKAKAPNLASYRHRPTQSPSMMAWNRSTYVIGPGLFGTRGHQPEGRHMFGVVIPELHGPISPGNEYCKRGAPRASA